MTTSTRLDELKRWPNWIVRRADKIPLNPHTGRRASVIDPQTWSTFEVAAACCANDTTLGLGFVLTEADPFCFIDLDYSDDPAIVANQKEISNGFNTYSERSPSTKGLHIIGKGSVLSGKKRNKVEVYSSKRYMTVTFDAVNNVPIAECQEQLNELLVAMNKGQTNDVPTEFASQPQTQSDDAVLAMAASAANGGLFKELLAGYREGGKYKSQSEADFAFIDIVAHYTDSIEQVKRIFLASALGERIRTGAKAKSKTYISDMVKKSWDHKVSPAVDPHTFTITSDVPFQAATASDKRCIPLIRGCDIEEVDQAWLIDSIIPDNTLTGVMGVPGIGKTTFVIGILAYFSQLDHVLMLTNEDNASDIRRTTKRLGGNLNNLYVEDSATDELPWLLDNYEALETTLKRYKPRIIGIDSFYSHAPNKADTNKHDGVAPSLVRLRKLANKYCPILLIHHDNKSNTTDPLKKSGGSLFIRNH